MSESPVERQHRRGENPPDAQLAERIRRGDTRAFEWLVEAHWGGLIAYARSLTGDHDSAQDAVQETFTRFWQARSGWRGFGSVRAYLYRAVRNRIIDWGRQRLVWKRWSTRWQRELIHDPRTPADLLEDGELPKALQKAISALPERRREVFVLAHLQDLTYQEIANIMELSPQSVANHMSLALRDLRKAVGLHFPQYSSRIASADALHPGKPAS